MELLVALAVGAWIAALLSSRPRVALVVWLASLGLLPVWLTVHVPFAGLDLSPSTVFALLVAPAALRARGRHRMAWGDWLLIAATLSMFASVVLVGSPRFMLVSLLTEGWTSYLIGRRLVPAVGERFAVNTIARGTLILAAWSIAELATGFHAFETLTTDSPLSFWNEVQFRGGVARSEAAWGHAISLGAGLSLGLPFVYHSTLKHVKPFIGILLTVAGALATLSRGPLLTITFGLVLCVAFLRSGVPAGRRFAVVVFGGAATLLLLPFALDFLGAVSRELNDSSDFRVNLLTHAAEDLHWLGPGEHVSTFGGQFLYRGFYTVDNAYLIYALVVGIIPAAILALGVIAALARTVLNEDRTAGDVAVASQLLVLGTVATITQYHPALFFTAGVAVSLATLTRTASADSSTVDPSTQVVTR